MQFKTRPGHFRDGSLGLGLSQRRYYNSPATWPAREPVPRRAWAAVRFKWSKVPNASRARAHNSAGRLGSPALRPGRAAGAGRGQWAAGPGAAA